MMGKTTCMAGTTGRLIIAGIIAAVMVPIWGGCTAGTYGRLQGSYEVTQVFENSQILSDHQYYYSGFQRVPYGIIGINNNYRLRSSLWKPIEMNPTELNQLSYRMQHVYSLAPRGAWILDPERNRVGVWYSSQNQTTVRMKEDKQIVVVPPEPPDLRGIP